MILDSSQTDLRNRCRRGRRTGLKGLGIYGPEVLNYMCLANGFKKLQKSSKKAKRF